LWRRGGGRGGAAARYRRVLPGHPAGPAGGEAIRATDSLNADHLNNSSAEAIATAMRGSTAALLHLADTIAQTNTTV
jgi:hypothetical protein